MKQSTLEELENDYWSEPDFPSHLVATCHRLRKKILHDFDAGDLRILIGQDISLPILMPMAVDLLRKNPLAEGDFYRGDLLKNAVTRDTDWFRKNPPIAKELSIVASQAIEVIRHDTEEFDPEEQLTLELLEVLVEFTRNWSSQT